MGRKKKDDMSRESSVKITYQGTTGKRSGKPILHITKNLKRVFIMVRAKGGGVKRLYLGTRLAGDRIVNGYRSLLKDADKFILEKLRKKR